MNLILRGVTPNDADVLAHVLVTTEKQTFSGRVPDQCMTFTEAESSANWQKFFARGIPAADFMLMAETVTGQVVGYIWGGSNVKDKVYSAELRQIHILPEFQGRGIGRFLVGNLARRLAEQSMHSMMVEVLHVNPNRSFYEHLGATWVSEHPYDWDGITLPMCVYGWMNTHELFIDRDSQNEN